MYWVPIHKLQWWYLVILHVTNIAIVQSAIVTWLPDSHLEDIFYEIGFIRNDYFKLSEMDRDCSQVRL